MDNLRNEKIQTEDSRDQRNEMAIIRKVHIRGHHHRRNVTYEGYQYPHFLDWGYRTPTIQDTGEEFAVIRGDLWRSNYTKTVLRRGSAPDPFTRELTSCLGSHFPNMRSLREGLQGYSPETLTRLYFFLLTCSTISFLALFCLGTILLWRISQFP